MSALLAKALQPCLAHHMARPLSKQSCSNSICLSTFWIAGESFFVRLMQVQLTLRVHDSLNQLTVCNPWTGLSACFKNICFITKIFNGFGEAEFLLFSVLALATEELGRRHCHQAKEREQHKSESLHHVNACFVSDKM